jgi:hypothetical protein
MANNYANYSAPPPPNYQQLGSPLTTRMRPTPPQSQPPPFIRPRPTPLGEEQSGEKESPPSTSLLPAGEPSGSSPHLHNYSRSHGETSPTSASGGSQNYAAAGSHRSVQTAPPAPRALVHSPISPLPAGCEFTTPLRDAGSGQATISMPMSASRSGPGLSGGSGRRSRARSRSGERTPLAIAAALREEPGSASSVAIGIDDSTGSGRVRHWKKMASQSSLDGTEHLAVAAEDARTISRTGSSGSGGRIQATIKRVRSRRNSDDRLPLYQPRTAPQHQNQPGGLSSLLVPSSYIAHLALLLGLLYVLADSKARVDRSAAQLRYYREEGARVHAKISEFEGRARHLKGEIERLREENGALMEEGRREVERLAGLTKPDDDDGNKDMEMVAAIEQERAKMAVRVSAIHGPEELWQWQERIQTESRREATEKFGPGPHQVEIDLLFPPDVPPVRDGMRGTGRTLSTTFRIEMASLADMPHSVQLFLEQVHHGLWDGCAFVWNPAHMVLAR